ncbi:MAG: serine/threonine protein kinase [Phycisphaerales bacterium]|nr:serine/threonine protein kinase [Phycisphaerales bacterium]
MITKLGNFEIISQINHGGSSIVYQARQNLGMGVTRPAAIKVLEGWQINSEAQMEKLRKEVSLMVQFSSSPHIVQVWESGYEDGLGPWVAMEFLGTSLKDTISDGPADAKAVRQVLVDALNGLMTIETLAPDTIHRDIKPSNILLGMFGSWKIADFGLAKTGAADDTLRAMSVQYTAPELLDAQRGSIGPWTDLYALGMTMYQFALGNKMFREQFPAIYTDQASKASDERPKWMFWHTSQQTLTPLAELIPGFPQELSDLIASMTNKDPAKRPRSAAGAIGLLGSQGDDGMVNLDAARKQMESRKPVEKPVISKPVAIALAAMIALIGFAGLVVFVLSSFRAPVSVKLASEGKFSTGAENVVVSGTMRDLPQGGVGMLTLSNGDEYPVRIADNGEFSADVRMPRVGKLTGTLAVRDSSRNLLPVVGDVQVSLERIPPTEVEIVVNLSPLIEGATVAFTTPTKTEISPQTTGEQGQAKVKLPRGKFTLSVEHPRYAPFKQEMETGDDLSKSVRVAMRVLSAQQVDARRQALMAQVQTAVLLAAQGDPDAIKRLAEIQKELALLDPDGKKRDPMGTIMGLIGSKGVAEADRGRLQQALADLATGGNGAAALAAQPEGRGRDGGAVIRPVSASTNADLAAAQANTALANRRVELLNEMASLQAKAAAGDPYAQQRLKDIAGELSDIESRMTGPKSAADLKRADLLKEYQRVAELAAKGDPEAIKRLAEIQKELSVSAHEALDAARDRERAVSSAIAMLAGVDPMTILKMTIPELRSFLSRQAPLDTLTFQDMPEINRVRVSGPVLSSKELQHLILRLSPANDRIVPEIGIDPLAVCKRIEKALGDAGAKNPRVRAAITPIDELVYVQFDGDERFTATQARSVATRFVLNADNVVVQDFSKVAKPVER